MKIEGSSRTPFRHAQRQRPGLASDGTLSQRKQARKKGLIGKVGVGAVVFGQRFGDSLNLNPHYHAIVPDGIFIKYDNQVVFHRLPFPKDEDVQFIAIRILRKIHRLLEKRRLLGDQCETEPPRAMDMLAQLALRRMRRRIWPARRIPAPFGREILTVRSN